LKDNEGRVIPGMGANDTFNNYVKPKRKWKKAEDPIPKKLASFEP
jgi:hypothetical protein